MQKIFLFLISLTFGMSSMAYAQSGNEKILGKWTNTDKTIVIEFVTNGSSYDAVIRKADDATLIGKKLITGLKSSGKNTYRNGTIHFIKRKKEADISAMLLADKKLELKVSNGWVSKKQTWSKL